MLLLTLLLVCSSLASTKLQNPRVAILGSGIGGSSTAYFLKQSLPGVQIDVFEMDKVGGRIATAHVAGREYEIGGSVIHPANRIMNQLVKICQLEDAQDKDFGPFSLHKGGEIVFQESTNSILTQLHMVWRYGAYSLYQLESFISRLLTDFDNIYPALESGLSFHSVNAILDYMSDGTGELSRLTTADLVTTLRSLHISDILIDELVMVASRVNYFQTPGQLHGLVGAVSLAGTQGSLWHVRGGNYRVAECLVRLAGADLAQRRVTAVTRQPNTGKFTLQLDGGHVADRVYDYVVVAFPLTQDKSEVEFVNMPEMPRQEGRYQRCVAQLVHGKLNATALGFGAGAEWEANVNFFIQPTDRLSSLAKLTPVDYDPERDPSVPDVYKIFSQEVLTRPEIREYFSEVESVVTADWLAYPHYPSRTYSKEKLGEFEVVPNLFYLNSIEWAASAMEMSALSGWNIANLVVNSTMQSHGATRDGPRNVRNEL